MGSASCGTFDSAGTSYTEDAGSNPIIGNFYWAVIVENTKIEKKRPVMAL